jgi:hypothetical protein
VNGRPWTGREVRDAVRWYAAGMRLPEMAVALDRTVNAIAHKMNDRGVTRGRRPVRVMEEDAAVARATLRAEIAAARAERGTAQPFKRGELLW